MLRPRYRILYNLPKHGWFDSPKNNRWNLSKAMQDALAFVKEHPTVDVKVINERSKHVVWQSSK